MHVGRILGATRNLGAPADWDRSKHGICGGLPIRDESTTAGKAMTSAWLPTPEEIERIGAGAPVYLTVIGQIHPPISMAVGPSPDAYVAPDLDPA